MWTLVHGSGYRATIDAMGADAGERVRSSVVAGMACQRVSELRADVLYSTLTKP